MMKMVSKSEAHAIADRCMDAYSANRYRSWRSVAWELAKCGYNPAQIEAIMRSKWARWAADGSDARWGRVPAKVLVAYATRNNIAEIM